MTTEDISLEPKGSEEGSKKEYRKSFRLSAQAIANLDEIKRATGVQNETEVTEFAYAYTARHLPARLAASRMVTRGMLREITGVVGVLGAFFAEAERSMKEQGAKPSEIQSLGTELLLHIADPIYIAAVLQEHIGDRPVWLRHSWKHHFQYEQAVDLLELYLSDLHSRYSARNRTWREEEADLVEDEEASPGEMGETDPEEDEDERSIRLYPGDIYALYDDTLNMYHKPDEEGAFLHGIRQSLGTFIPHLGEGDQKRIAEKAR